MVGLTLDEATIAVLANNRSYAHRYARALFKARRRDDKLSEWPSTFQTAAAASTPSITPDSVRRL